MTLRRSHTTGLQSKVHPTYKTKYRVANWAAYNQAVVRRGDVTVWLSSDAIAAWTPRWGAACVGTPRVGCATSAVGRDDRLGDRIGARAGHGALVEGACFRRPPAAVST